MVPAPFRVVLDANVLFPFTVRDTLLRAAALGMYQVHWSEQLGWSKRTCRRGCHTTSMSTSATLPTEVRMDERRERAAHELVAWHFEVEPDLREVYVLVGDEGEPIRLLEVNDATVRSARFEAFVFAPTKDVPFATAIAEVTPDELDQLRRTPGGLPPEWDLSRAEIVKRPKAA